MATALDENHTKIYRMLETLEAENFLKKNEATKKYSLGFAVWELGITLYDSFHVSDIIHPSLKKLCDRTGESTFLTVLDQQEAVTFDAVEADNTVKFSVAIGDRAPLYAGASYRSILAYMPDAFIQSILGQELVQYTESTMTSRDEIERDLYRIREKGYALSYGEYTRDVVAVAVPIFNKGRIAGSVTVSGPQYRIDEKKEKHFIDELKQTKEEIELSFQRYNVSLSLQ
ncbi:IclR family transcriptional regulator [Geomicrobium sp. JCM 19039]|uniref:IclR family transcriptional regulator n=1 Tax=Geomicrobium sp. JCM 19039 TaxID=1460636 RepID=UPI001EE6917F|nr:IclR family transcriptional regulator [Geomicrobium sp. JCM 19039]